MSMRKPRSVAGIIFGALGEAGAHAVSAIAQSQARAAARPKRRSAGGCSPCAAKAAAEKARKAAREGRVL